MNKKLIIVSQAKKNRSKFEDKNPTEIYNIMKGHEGYRQLFKIFTPKEFCIFLFLLKAPIEDLSIAYDVINYSMYAYQIVFLVENEPYGDCDDCNGYGQVRCEDCDGSGNADCRECDANGKVECNNCDGDGEIDGESCDSCSGDGEVTCDYCDGEGTVECQNCNGGETTCYECNGTGESLKEGKIGYEFKHVITYSPDVLNKMEDSDDYEKMESNFYEKIIDSDFNLIIKIGEQITDEFNSYDIGDELVVQVIHPNALDIDLLEAYNTFYISEFSIF